MELTYSPAALPGSCYFCGSGSREFYIDTKLSVEFHGAMYICNICADHIARLIRYIPHDDYKDLVAENEEMGEAAYQLRVQVDHLEAAIRGLTGAGYGLNNNVVDALNADFLETVDEPVESVSEGTGELGERTGTPSESSDDKDVGKLRPDDSSDESNLFGFLGGDSSKRSK